MTDSAQLQKDLARVALADRAAFARVYQATSAHLFGVALRILNRRDAAEDVLQEAFVSVWHHAGSYQAASGQPMTWMISIVRNKALDVVRSAAVRHETEMPVTAEGEAIASQWAFKGKPVYLFAGDVKAGDVNGDKQGGVWHVLRGESKKTSAAPDTSYSAGYNYN